MSQQRVQRVDQTVRTLETREINASVKPSKLGAETDMRVFCAGSTEGHQWIVDPVDYLEKQPRCGSQKDFRISQYGGVETGGTFEKMVPAERFELPTH